ncbi:MAG TPA: zf-HC2 domain-containing protein [Pyrinomonadaceae bacterium]|jgi:anti-sigma factor RsiW|nr:zf-HC2 domain-containing protein [Pyrinomonadaceae bacterium]
MLCSEFEDCLTDYLDGLLAPAAQVAFNGHALRCPVCHDLLSEVKNTLRACRTATPPAPAASLDARILMQTAPESAMTCGEFEDYLTDFLDGFLPATLYHRWERHAALCGQCTNLPGEVVRSIGACYTYISEERPVPAALHARILQATLGTTEAERLRAPLGARLAEWMRGWLDVIVSPQLATVATMLLVAVLVGTSTLSDDGSIGGMYRASLRFASRTYERGANLPVRRAVMSGDLKGVAGSLENLLGSPGQDEKQNAQPARNGSNEQQQQQAGQQKR